MFVGSVGCELEGRCLGWRGGREGGIAERELKGRDQWASEALSIDWTGVMVVLARVCRRG